MLNGEDDHVYNYILIINMLGIDITNKTTVVGNSWDLDFTPPTYVHLGPKYLMSIYRTIICGPMDPFGINLIHILFLGAIN